MSDSFLKELSGVGDLLQAQVDAGMNGADVMEQLVRSFEARIDAHPALRSEQKAALTAAINAGPWTADQKKMLATAVLANGVKKSKTSASSKKRANQQAHNIENLLPMDTMAKLKDRSKFSIASMLSLIASAARSLGLENPDNTTLYRMVAIVAAASETDMDQQTVWNHMNTLQRYVKSKTRGAPTVEYITNYPPTSELLPADIQQNAYNGMLPPEVSWPELDTVLGACKMKGGRHATGKLPVTKTKTTTQNCSPEEPAPTTDMPLPSPDVFRFRVNSRILPASTPLAADMLADKSEPQSASSICSKCAGPLDAGPHVHHDAAPAKVITDAANDGDHDSELDEFEAGMLGAIVARSAAKKVVKCKPAGAPSSVMKTMCMKKKKGAEPMHLRRPAAASTSKKKKAVPGWSMNKRIDEYPEGCAKCRGSPGCTFSCFKYRHEI